MVGMPSSLRILASVPAENIWGLTWHWYQWLFFCEKIGLKCFIHTFLWIFYSDLETIFLESRTESWIPGVILTHLSERLEPQKKRNSSGSKATGKGSLSPSIEPHLPMLSPITTTNRGHALICHLLEPGHCDSFACFPQPALMCHYIQLSLSLPPTLCVSIFLSSSSSLSPSWIPWASSPTPPGRSLVGAGRQRWERCCQEPRLPAEKHMVVWSACWLWRSERVTWVPPWSIVRLQEATSPSSRSGEDSSRSLCSSL